MEWFLKCVRESRKAFSLSVQGWKHLSRYQGPSYRAWGPVEWIERGHLGGVVRLWALPQ